MYSNPLRDPVCGCDLCRIVCRNGFLNRFEFDLGCDENYPISSKQRIEAAEAIEIE